MMYKAELCHHGILGQRWGVRRFQNPDGSLTTAGKKRYYTENLGSTDYKRLGKKGHEFNKKASAAADRMTNAVYANVRKANPNFEKELEVYKQLRKANHEDYEKELNKWLNAEGEYKKKDYYQFKDIARDKWLETDQASKELASQKRLEKMVTDAAKEHPLYNKTYKRLRDININPNNEVFMEKINIGEEAVKTIMNRIDREVRQDWDKTPGLK